MKVNGNGYLPSGEVNILGYSLTVSQTERKIARRFVKVSEDEIVAINEAAFCYPSDLVSTKTTIPSGSVKSGGYIP